MYNRQHAVLFAAFVLTVLYVEAASELPPNHLKPFGWGIAKQAEQVEGFLPVKRFFEEYVIPNKPVVMRGANKVWPGFTNWQTDEYFAKIAPEEPFIISMDVKRGTPDTPSDYVDFKEFLQKYNTSNRRMIEHTPPFLWPDVFLPGSLGCDIITQGEVLMGHKMWYGTNYTTSVVHKDAADNINCLVYGTKKYTILAPKYDQHVYLDRPDGLYSTMNVDKVDAEKYPGLENVEYQTTELKSGDCVFIPYKWIHQVRSYGRNIAVNVWWNHWKNPDLDLSECPESTEKKPISTAKFHGWGDFESRDEGVREHTYDLLSMAYVLQPVNYIRWLALFTSTNLESGEDPMDMLRRIDPDIKKALRVAFLTIDLNKDKRITPAEMDALSEEESKTLIKHIRYILHESRVRSKANEMQDKLMKKEEEEEQTKRSASRKESEDLTAPGLTPEHEERKNIPEHEGRENVANSIRHDEF